MTLPKIQLSEAELNLISDASIILTKNKALEKIKCMLQEAQHAMQQSVAQDPKLNNNEIFRLPPKISRGEQYLGLPWMILDYPRIFRADGIVAIRSLFWWGHFFSSTLHVSGNYAPGSLHGAYGKLEQHYLGISSDPWQHHFSEDNYRKICDIGEKEWPGQLSVREHLKIAIRWPVSDLADIPLKFYENWSLMLSLLSYPDGETGLSPDNPKASTGP